MPERFNDSLAQLPVFSGIFALVQHRCDLLENARGIREKSGGNQVLVGSRPWVVGAVGTEREPVTELEAGIEKVALPARASTSRTQAAILSYCCFRMLLSP